MNWFYVLDGQQSGPVSEAQLDELLRAGTLNRETLVWREEMPDWQPLHQARAALPPPLPLGQPVLVAASAVCAECWSMFPQSEMIFLNRSWVCARCKPIFLQRLQEGVASSAGGGQVWRTKRQMILRHETPFPDRCVRCNAPANGYRLKRQLYWHPPFWYVLVVISILIYAIVALCIRKKSLIHIGLCEQHRSQRKWAIAGSWLAVLAGVVLIGAAIGGAGGNYALIGIAVLIGGAVFGSIKGGVVSAGKIDGEYVWVKGANQSFLGSLPEWMG